jgi:predicted  nucleic acid-binding Zn-ribbon protein
VGLTAIYGSGITAAMLSPALEKLLVFQDRDQRRLALETQIKHVPDEIAVMRRRIEEDRAGVEAAKAAWRETEAKRKTIESEIGAAEQKAARFKTQQLEVRKNDEYQALGHEIETVQAQVAALEEQELLAMYGLDEAKARVQAAEVAAAAAVALHEARIRTLQEKEATMHQELAALQGELDKARAEVPVPAMEVYVRIVKRVSLPVCVPLLEQRCMGCNLKVSSGVASDARAGAKLVNCDNCGRIVFYES